MSDSAQEIAELEARLRELKRAQRQKPKAERNAAIIARYVQDDQPMASDVATEFGVHPTTVLAVVKRAGVFRDGRIERMKALHADPEFKARHSERMRERMKALNADPEFKARHSERMKALHADPEFKARNSAARWGDERLPDMEPAQRKLYTKLRANGIPKRDALNEALAHVS